MTDRSQVQEHQADEKGCRSCRVPPGQLHDPGCGADPGQGGIDYDYYARARVSYEQLRRWLENSADHFEEKNEEEDRHSQFHTTLRVAAARLKKTEVIAAHILAAAGAAARKDAGEAYHFLYWAAVELTGSDDPEALDRLAAQVSVVEDAEIAADLRDRLEGAEMWDGDEHTARWVGSGNYLQGEGPEDAEEDGREEGWSERARNLLGKLLEDIQGGRTDSVVDCPCSRVAGRTDEIADLLSEAPTHSDADPSNQQEDAMETAVERVVVKDYDGHDLPLDDLDPAELRDVIRLCRRRLHGSDADPSGEEKARPPNVYRICDGSTVAIEFFQRGEKDVDHRELLTPRKARELEDALRRLRTDEGEQ